MIHHGEAGTTAASLRAGIPTIIVPHLADQAFWGKRVESLGVGPRAISREKLTADRLAGTLRTANTDTRMKQRAADLEVRIRGEFRIARAMELVEQHLSVHATRPVL